MNRLLLLFIILFAAAHAYAEERISTNNFFDKAEREVVLKDGIITKSFLKNNNSAYTPNTNGQINIPVTQYTEKDLAGYEMICVEKTFFPYELTGESKLSVYNNLASAAKLKDMQYYSRTDSKIETLITSSSRIASSEDKTPNKDSVYTSISPKTVNYFTITDNRFGDLTFRSELYSEGENFILKNVCVEPMEKYFISINNKEEYKLITFFIYNKESKGYFYYSINAMRIRSGYFLKLGMLSAENFANRMRGSTVHTAKLLGLDWGDKIKAFQ
jgi:hypothetical protein